MPNTDLHTELRGFLDDHPQGWEHVDWLALLERLSGSGHDTSDPDALGLALESLRLAKVLAAMEVKGLGPKRIQALANHYGTLWNLMCASVDDVARVPGLNRSVAEQVLNVLQ